MFFSKNNSGWADDPKLDGLTLVVFFINLCWKTYVNKTLNRKNIKYKKRKNVIRKWKHFTIHTVKIVEIWSFFWSEYGKTLTRKNSVFGHFSRNATLSNPKCIPVSDIALYYHFWSIIPIFFWYWIILFVIAKLLFFQSF